MDNRSQYTILIGELQNAASTSDLGKDSLSAKTKDLYSLADSQQQKFLDALSVGVFGKSLQDLFRWSNS